MHLDNPRWNVSGHFLNVQLQVLEVEIGDYLSTKFDKRRHLPFKFHQYILFKSNHPIKKSYSVVVSQLVLILYMANTTSLAMDEIHRLANTLKQNRFDIKRIHKLIFQYCTRNTFPGLRFPMEEMINILQDIKI